MNIDMVMPQMGESIAEATIARWLKSPGDTVEKDELILEISTDKVDSEIPAPASGVLKEVLFKEGDVVPVKVKIAVIDTAGGSVTASSAAVSTPAPQVSPEENIVVAEVAPAPANGNGVAHVSAPTPSAQTSSTLQATSTQTSAAGDSRFYSPVVKSLAKKHGVCDVELATVAGTGQGGRVTKQDFLDYVSQRGQQGAAQQSATQQTAATAQPAPSAPQPSAQVPATVPSEYKAPAVDIPTGEWTPEGTKVVPMDNMRKLIAEHMVRSKRTSPHVYSVQEIDCSKIAAWRAKHKNEFKSREGFSLSFTPFFLEAAVRALLEFPMVNSSVDGNTVIMKKKINLGCAVALGNTGLIVPVIKSAEERNFVGIARALNDLATRARNKQLLPDEVAGGTFTVTNPGVFGTMIGTPIINQPQVAILCLGEIKKRPVVIDDMIGIREISYLTLSYDHRIVDGALGGQFLAFIREYLENWDLNRPLY
ncbi:MAG: dihydrolipoamide acetyltransferase family protein [Bdellovibrionota bacterium]